MTKMVEEEAKEKRSKGLALKSFIPYSNESDEENAECSKSENLTHILESLRSS